MYTYGPLYLESEDQIQGDLLWLRYNKTPWTEVLTKWRTTAAFRVTAFKSGIKTISDFPLLLDNNADALVLFYLLKFVRNVNPINKLSALK